MQTEGGLAQFVERLIDWKVIGSSPMAGAVQLRAPHQVENSRRAGLFSVASRITRIGFVV
jgi:hypothetical protein